MSDQPKHAITDLEQCTTQLRYWGNGGGCMSLTEYFKELLEDIERENPAATKEQIREYLYEQDAPMCHLPVYRSVIDVIIDDEDPVQKLVNLCQQTRDAQDTEKQVYGNS